MNRLEIINELINRSNLTITEMADEMGITINNFYLWKKGKNKPKSSTVNKLSEVLGLKLKWLSDDDVEIIREPEITVSKPFPVPISDKQIPVITQASAGLYTYPEVLQMTDTTIKVTKGTPEDAFGFEVIGDSAQDFVNDGDICIVSPRKPFVNNRPCFVALRDGSQFIKKVNKSNGIYTLKSINKDYEDMKIPEKEVVAVYPILHTKYKV